MFITRYVLDILLNTLVRWTRIQEVVPVGKKIEALVPRIIALGEQFDSNPSDIAEQRCREGVKRYVITFLLYSVLNTSQKIQEY